MPYHHFSAMERKTLDSMGAMRYGIRRMAQVLRRSPSSVSRELRRNREAGRGYNPHLAQLRYMDARKRLVRAPKTGDPLLMEYVRGKLREHWSPEQIAGRLRREHPETPSRWVSHETIYRYVCADKRAGGTLWKHLRRGRRQYGKRGRGPHPNRLIKGRVSIHERPAMVADQSRIGDWEGDTFFGRHRESCVATLTERKSLYLVAQKMPDCAAPSLNRAVITGFGYLPRALVKTLTVDNGKEFAGFKALEDQLHIHVYFADPYTAWQRAIGENLNGLLRQFLPRKSDFRNLDQETLDVIVLSLNNRPRKKLNYRTPCEVLEEATVALDT
jgi:IS30 family transposase